jgi:copper(I)-binding protein
MMRLAARSAIVLSLFAGLPALAEDFKAGSLEISAPWTRATPPGATVAAGFMAITNTGTEADRLVGGTFTGAKRVEVHEMAVIDGVMTMKPLENGLEIKPGETVTLKPGSYHMMFLEIDNAVAEGKPVAGALKFEKAGEVAVTFEVSPIGAGKPGEQGAGDGKGSGHGAMHDGH